MAEWIQTTASGGGGTNFSTATAWVSACAIDQTHADVFLCAGTLTGAMADGDTVTWNGGADTGTVVGFAKPTQVLIQRDPGETAPADTDTLTLDGSNYFDISGTPVQGSTGNIQPVLECGNFTDSMSGQLKITTADGWVNATSWTSKNIIVRAATEHGGSFSSGSMIQANVIFQPLVHCYVNYTILQGLRCKNTSTGNNAGGLSLQRIARADRCIVIGSNNAQGNGIYIEQAASQARACIAQNWKYGYYSPHFINGEVYNCGAEGCGTYGFYKGGTVGTLTIKNCWAIHSGTSDYVEDHSSGFSDTINASEDTTATTIFTSGIQISASDGVDLVAPSTDDYRVESSGALDSAGDDLGATFDFDIANTNPVVNWNIGPYDEVVGGGGGLGIPEIMMLQRKRNVVLLTM